MGSYKRFIGSFICLLAALVLSKESFAAAFIVEIGKANAEIIISDLPTRMQDYAAKELQEYVKKLTGAIIPIRKDKGDAKIKIYVGKSKFTDQMGLDNSDLDYGAYRMVSGDNYLVLLGNDTNYFMNKPGDAGPEFPASMKDRKKADEDWSKKHGDIWSNPFSPSFKEYNPILGLWSTDRHGSLNAVNDFLRSLGVEWYMPGDFGECLPDIKSIALPEKINRTVRPECGERNFAFHSGNPFQASADEFKWQLRLGLFYDTRVQSGHGTDALISTEKVKKEHPEYFAKYGDTRNTGKPCYSSEGLAKSAVGYASLLFDEYNKDVVSFLPTDAYISFCQCELCKGKDTPERGFNGMMSDYVWGFMNNLAAEVAKTHPNKRILCFAYNTYREAPLKIEKFHPNLEVGLCQGRKSFSNPEEKITGLKFREELIKKSASGKIRLWEYYSPGIPVPMYYPAIISEDLKKLKGHILGTMVECQRTNSIQNKGQPDPLLATNHVNIWLTTRLWWDPNQDVDKMMTEYYKAFYGPAAGEMKAFIEHCEKTWRLMRIECEPIEKAFELMEVARKAAGSDNIYARRVQMVADYIKPLEEIKTKLKIGRSKNPVATFKEFDKVDIKLDGKMDEAFWQDLESYNLDPVHDKMVVKQGTTFKVFYAGDSIYFGVRCEEADMGGIISPAVKDDDNSIFNGDSVEILLESPSISYYQLAFDPKGNMNDIKRSGAALGMKGKIETKWKAGIESAAFKGDNFWSIEVKIPVLGSGQDELLPFFGVSGDKPSKDMPWYFNVGRNRSRENREISTFSPSETGGFHDVMKFGKLAPR